MNLDLLTPSRAAPPAHAATEHWQRDRPRPTQPKVCCVIPCYNEAKNLQLLLPRLRDFLAARFTEWDVVLVDDGSRDDTVAVFEHWTAQPRFTGIELSRNFGKEAALSAGLEAAEGDVIVLLDADLQHPPELIEAMVERWRDGADVVYALRSDRSQEPGWKRMGVRVFYRLMNAGDRFEIPAGAGDFRLMDRQVVRALLALPERNRFMKGLYAWVGFRAEAVPYVPAEREHGRTSFSLLRLLRLSVDGLTGFTTWPLRAVSVFGAIIATLSFLYGTYIVVDFLANGNEVSGWTTIIVFLLLFAGIQMLSIGVLGEYIARIFEEVKHRPLYIVRRRRGRGTEASE